MLNTVQCTGQSPAPNIYLIQNINSVVFENSPFSVIGMEKEKSEETYNNAKKYIKYQIFSSILQAPQTILPERI